MSSIARCGLHHGEAELRDSHFMPKSLYKLLRKSAVANNQSNPNPVAFTPAVAIQTSEQVSDYFLCHDCEQRFSSRGEKWVVANCWHSDTDFPLRSAVENASPRHVSESGLKFYEAASISAVDISQIVYFALSVFWRAAARQWSPIAGHVPTKLSLGPYEEELRLFLLDQGPFPSNAALVITVSSVTDEGANQSMLFPYLSNKKSGCKQYRLFIPGVTFQLFIGKGIPATLRACCIAQSDEHLIFYGPNEFMLSDMFKLAEKGTPKGSLAK